MYSIVAFYTDQNFLLLFYLFFILGLSCQIFPNWLSGLSNVLIFVIHVKLLVLYYDGMRSLNDSAIKIYEASQYIKSNSTVLPVNESGHWFQPHFSNYLGIDNPMVILENYEAGLEWFPVNWKDSDHVLQDREYANSLIPCLDNLILHKNKFIDYILIWGYSKPDQHCLQEREKALNKGCKLTYASQDSLVKLYQLME